MNNQKERKTARTPEPCLMVIFGATGDLTKRKLIPALYHLYSAGVLHKNFSVLGISRGEISDGEFRNRMKDGVKEFGKGKFNAKHWKEFSEGLFSMSADYGNDESYRKLKEKAASIMDSRGITGNKLFYLAVPPEAYATIVGKIGEAGLHGSGSDGAWVRVIIEKPIGYDIESARNLNDRFGHVFNEDQIYRIDHFLGKETVQNLLVFRFANGIFEPIWNRNYIDHVQITAAEKVGVENRGGYYEKAGALRDMVQNHLLQVLAQIAMEPPARFDATAFRDEKVKVFQSVQAIKPKNVDRISVRAQYRSGTMDGKKVPGYRQEKGIAPDSMAETFVALKLTIDNWRWAGVPFFLRTGKRLAKRCTEVVLVFKQAPHQIFSSFTGLRENIIDSNILVLRIQPDEGISLRFGAKSPGQGMDVQPVTMDFNYDTSFDGAIADAYERLLLDAMYGDASLFARRDGVEACWGIINPILEAWEGSQAKILPVYDPGSWGPDEAHELLRRDRCWWRE
jgi:glucose-6-phosphate 1-dehydrogenase